MNSDAAVLTKSEAAEILRVHTKTIEKLLQNGQLRRLTAFPGKVLIPRSSLDRFIEGDSV